MDIQRLRSRFLPALLCAFTLANFELKAGPPGIILPGFKPNSLGVHALTGATVVVKPGETLEGANVIIRDGLIERVGKDVAIPADARVWDMKGMTIYAGFIDPYLTVAARTAAATAGTGRGGIPQQENLTAGTVRFFGTTLAERDAGMEGPGYELAKVTPERHMSRNYVPDTRANGSLREIGFTAANITPASGIIRGISTLVALSDDSANETIIRPDVFQNISLDSGGGRGGGYPGSLMGIIAVIRQSFFDAEHYQLDREDYARHPNQRTRPEFNPGQEALEPVMRKKMTVVFDPKSALMVDRATQLARELNLDYYLVSSGQEWRRPELAKAAGVPFIVPLNFPTVPRLPSEDDWEQVTLDELRAWDWAAENPAVLRKQGLEIALTTTGLSDKSAFRRNLKSAIDRGLTEADALAALTTIPARLCGVDRQMGTIEPGKLANLTVVDGKGYFDTEAKVRSVWIDGKLFRNASADPAPADGNSTNSPAGPRPEVTDAGSTNKTDSAEAKKPEQTTEKKDDTAVATVAQAEPGAGRRGGAGRQGRGARAMEAQKRVARSPLDGRGVITNPPSLLIRNATIWTAGPLGKLENADLFVQSGKIQKVGTNLFGDAIPANTDVIDGTGLHVSPGIIDCHSHSMILGGVNEGSLPSSAMVRIADVVNSETPNIYDQLAGGVTAANLLHGSANPIGGQNCVIKLRDGEAPEGLKFKDAPPGIKFALGENVKQSNGGGGFGGGRFPATRMGVQTFFQNRFTEAQQYLKAWDEYKRVGGLPPARDLELEALGEIIEGKRLVHCHSYRQDEILMMIRVADQFGVHIGTFQHVLEGYKIADEIAKHGAGASTFSDWWAYKFEVYDAIPYNGTLMHDRGVVVSFNSDDNDLARRLYLEAAKAVKYGGLSEDEAIKFVTLNPAKQLHIDKKVGSLEPGKDADFALWSKSPLDFGTVCRQTWIEGKEYFDISLSGARTEALAKERKDLIAKAKRPAAGGFGGGRGGRGGRGGGGAPPPEDDPGNTFFEVSLEHQFDGKIRHCED